MAIQAAPARAINTTQLKAKQGSKISEEYNATAESATHKVDDDS
jgi:hypothetical protein